MPEQKAPESAVGDRWACGGWVGGIREDCQWEVDFEDSVGFEYTQMNGGGLAKETTHAKVWRQELAVCFQEAEHDGR